MFFLLFDLFSAVTSAHHPSAGNNLIIEHDFSFVGLRRSRMSHVFGQTFSKFAVGITSSLNMIIFCFGQTFSKFAVGITSSLNMIIFILFF
jgi:hypothetical protein